MPWRTKVMRACKVEILFSLLLLTQAAFAQDSSDGNDTADTATLLVVGDETPLIGSLLSNSDEDWYVFPVQASLNYTLQVVNVGAAIDPEVYLFEFDPVANPGQKWDDGFNGENEDPIPIQAGGTGLYYVRVRQAPEVSITATDDIEYTIAVFEPTAPFAGPDLELRQVVDYATPNQGSTSSLSVSIANLGGQQQDNTARNVQFVSSLTSGLAIQGNLPEGCSLAGPVLTCNLGDIAEQQSTALQFNLAADSVGRQLVSSTVKAYNDPARTSQQSDSPLSNNQVGSELRVVERSAFGVNLRGNRTQYRSGDDLQIAAKFDVTAADAAIGAVDLYFAVRLADGNTLYLASPEPVISAEPVPFLGVVGWTPYSVPDSTILSVPSLPALPPGNYVWTLTLTAAGSDVRQLNSRIAEASFSHSILP